jgi:hypothetical protein
LRRIAAGVGVKEAWAELWERLYHQGDVGEASYAAVTALAPLAAGDPGDDWNPFALAAMIEEARLNARNPAMPAWLAEDYARAWSVLFQTALAKLGDAEDPSLVNSIMAVLAAHKRQPMLARMAILNEEERRAMLDEVGWA